MQVFRGCGRLWGMAKFYDLEGQEVSYETWGEIFSGTDRFLAGERIAEKRMRVSTVWIGLAWGWEAEGEKPLIFETMAFADDEDSWDDLGCWRWASREEALKGHAEIVDGIRSGTVALADVDE